MVFGVGAFLPLDANAVRTKLRGWRSQWLDGFSRAGLLASKMGLASDSSNTLP